MWLAYYDGKESMPHSHTIQAYSLNGGNDKNAPKKLKLNVLIKL